MNLSVEIDQEADGRWIAEVPEVPGALAYGRTPEQASAKAKALAFRVIADRFEREDTLPVRVGVFATVS